MTQPALDTDEQLSGRAADAVDDMHGELSRRYSSLNTAEAQLAEALLGAHATSEAGRQRLQTIQRQLVEAIVNPVNALDTPAGERQFLMFLRTKIAEIQGIVTDGALTADDQAALTRALANGYLDGPAFAATPSTTAAAQPSVAAAPMPSPAPALGGLPQAMPGSGGGPGTATPPPLAWLSSLLDGQGLDGQGLDGRGLDGRDGGTSRGEDDPRDDDDSGGNDDSREEDDPRADEDAPTDKDAPANGDVPAGTDTAPLGDAAPAETRPDAS